MLKKLLLLIYIPIAFILLFIGVCSLFLIPIIYDYFIQRSYWIDIIIIIPQKIFKYDSK